MTRWTGTKIVQAAEAAGLPIVRTLGRCDVTGNGVTLTIWSDGDIHPVGCFESVMRPGVAAKMLGLEEGYKMPEQHDDHITAFRIEEARWMQREYRHASISAQRREGAAMRRQS